MEQITDQHKIFVIAIIIQTEPKNVYAETVYVTTNRYVRSHNKECMND